MLKLLGLATGGGWIPLAIVFAIGLAAGASGAAYVQQLRLDAVQATVDSYQREANDADNRAAETVEKAKTYLDAYNQMKANAEKLDADAKAQKARDDIAVADLTAAKQAAEGKAATYRTELEGKADEPGATAASVGRAALVGLR